ncbi:MAG TPA: hypothetical protein VMF30_15370 [Pirellulales bacterium]|nr:hypothetical protein [Pirellulales bacterium]
MSHHLLRFALGLIVSGGWIASAQAQGGGAFPMNVEDRIAQTADTGRWSGYDDDRPITAAGAYPMNTLDRIDAGYRAWSSRRLGGSATASRAAGSEPTVTDRPDGWRYRWHRGQWWYYGADKRWLVWNGGQWNKYAPPATHAAGD